VILRRSLAAGAATALAFLVAAAAAWGAGAGISLWFNTGGKQDHRDIQLSDLPGTKEMEVTYPDGTKHTVQGIPLRTLFEQTTVDGASFDPVPYPTLDVTGDQGAQKFVTQLAVSDSRGAIVFATGDATNPVGFLLPAGKDAGPVLVVGPDLMHVTMRSKSLTDFTAEISGPTKLKPGQKGTWKVKVKNAPTGADLALSWSAGGDTNLADTETFTTKFPKAGQFNVGVTVDADPAGSTSAVVLVKVGEPKKSKKNRTGGGTNDSADAPETGTYDGGDTSGTYGGGYDPGAGIAASAAAVPPSTPATPKTKTQPEPEPETKTETTTAAIPPATKPPDQTLDQLPGPVTEVRGEVLTGPSPTAAVAPQTPAEVQKAAEQSARTGTPREEGSDFEIPTAVWAFLAVAVLLVAGWWLDTERFRAPRTIPPVP
jgi:hypothetical protein